LIGFEHIVEDGLAALFFLVFVLLLKESLLQVVVLVVQRLDPVLIDAQFVCQFFVRFLVAELLV
jgi:hypothetical protein